MGSPTAAIRARSRWAVSTPLSERAAKAMRRARWAGRGAWPYGGCALMESGLAGSLGAHGDRQLGLRDRLDEVAGAVAEGDLAAPQLGAVMLQGDHDFFLVFLGDVEGQ